MLKKILFVLVLFSFFLIPKKVFAVSVSISNYPSSIGSDAFNITVSVSGASAGTNYIRADLYKDGSQNYFGETHNGNDWYSGSDGKQYFPITIQAGTVWNGQVQVRAGFPNISDYDGQGSYKLRVRRYTSSGGQGGEEPNLSAVSVTINIPTITPTPTSSPTPTNQPTPTKTPTPTDSPTPTKTPSPTPTKSQSPTPTKFSSTSTPTLGSSRSSLSLASDTQGNVFEDNSSPTPTPQVEVLGATTSKSPLLFIGLGLIFICVCGILAYFQFGDKIMSKFGKNE